MGTLGLYDEDAERYIHTVFNLEIMKCAAYYKNKREIVTLAPSFCPDKYSNFIYRKDYNDGDFPANLSNIPNLRFGGLAFSNNNYISLNEKIEATVPDTSIYEATKRRFSSSGLWEDMYITMRSAAHLRLSLDGINIWSNFEKQLDNPKKYNTLFLHDYTLGSIREDYEIVKDLLKQFKQNPNEARIAAKFPIQVTSEQQMLNWASIPSSFNFFTLAYNGIIPDEVIYELAQHNYSFGKKLEYDITSACYNEENFFNKVLPQIFKQVIFSRSHRLKISLKYDEDFFKEKGWNKIIDLFNSYAVSLYDSVSKEKLKLILRDDSLYSFVKKMPEKATLKTYITDRSKAREVFNLIREKNYDLFTDFYECHQVEFIGGKFINA